MGEMHHGLRGMDASESKFAHTIVAQVVADLKNL